MNKLIYPELLSFPLSRIPTGTRDWVIDHPGGGGRDDLKKASTESRTTGIHLKIRAGPTFAILDWTVPPNYNYLRGRPLYSSSSTRKVQILKMLFGKESSGKVS